MYCIIGAHRFMGLFQPFFPSEDVVCIESEGKGKIHLRTSFWNTDMGAATSSHSSTDGTLGSEPHC